MENQDLENLQKINENTTGEQTRLKDLVDDIEDTGSKAEFEAENSESSVSENNQNHEAAENTEQSAQTVADATEEDLNNDNTNAAEINEKPAAEVVNENYANPVTEEEPAIESANEIVKEEPVTEPVVEITKEEPVIESANKVAEQKTVVEAGEDKKTVKKCEKKKKKSKKSQKAEEDECEYDDEEVVFFKRGSFKKVWNKICLALLWIAFLIPIGLLAYILYLFFS